MEVRNARVKWNTPSQPLRKDLMLRIPLLFFNLLWIPILYIIMFGEKLLFFVRGKIDYS